MMTAQIKIVARDDVIEKFKKIALTKHGKLELSVEGEEALRLYIKKYEHLLHELCPPDEDPLRKMIGIGSSSEGRNALADLGKLEAGKL